MTLDLEAEIQFYENTKFGFMHIELQVYRVGVRCACLTLS